MYVYVYLDLFENLSIRDKIFYISSIYVYTSGLWAHYLIPNNVLIDSKTFDSPLSLILSSNLYNHFGPYLIPKLLNQDSFNNLFSISHDSNLISLNNSIRAFNRICNNKCAINYVIEIFNKNKINTESSDKSDIITSYGNIWIFNKFLSLLCDNNLKLYNNVNNRSSLINLIDSIELLLKNLPNQECEVPYQFISNLASTIIDTKDNSIKERLLYILLQLFKNENNIKKLLLAEKTGFDTLFNVSNNLLIYQSEFNIFEYTKDILTDCPILSLLYKEFDNMNILDNLGQLQHKIITSINLSLLKELNNQLPLIDYNNLIDYKIRRFIDDNKLFVQFTLLYTSFKDFFMPLNTVGFTKTFQRGIQNSFKTLVSVMYCKLIFSSENALINSYRYYNSNLFMIPMSLCMAVFNMCFLIRLLKYNRNCKCSLI